MTLPDPNLLLMGLRGSGKSTIGRALAAEEGLSFLDLDDVTAAFLHSDRVGEAWSRFGEAAVRDAERLALEAALRDSGRIIALGGGTPTAPGAADLIRHVTDEGRARVAYLRCAPAELRARLSSLGVTAMEDRPSLTGGDPLEEIEAVYARRDGLYQSLATRTIEGISTVDDALAALREWRSWRAG